MQKLYGPAVTQLKSLFNQFLLWKIMLIVSKLRLFLKGLLNNNIQLFYVVIDFFFCFIRQKLYLKFKTVNIEVKIKYETVISMKKL